MYSDLDPKKLNTLMKAVKGNRFHFIIIQYNHYDVVYNIKKIIQEKYPNRTTISIRGSNQTYETLLNQILKPGNQFVYIDDFEKVIRNHDLYIGLNQRRDKITANPIQLICFLPAIDIYIKELIKNLPDLWSVRDLILEFKIISKPPEIINFEVPPKIINKTSSLGGDSFHEKLKELDRIENEIKSFYELSINKDIIEDLYSQVLILCNDTASYAKGLHLANQWLEYSESQNPEIDNDLLRNKIIIRTWIASFYTEVNSFGKALENLFIAKDILVSLKQDKDNLFTQTYFLIAFCYFHKKNYYESINYSNLALSSHKEYVGQNPEKEDTIITYNINIVLAWSLGNIDKYREAYDVLYNFLINNNGEKESKYNISLVQTTLASFLELSGDFTKAQYYLEEAYERELNEHGPKHQNLLNIQKELGEIYSYLGRKDESEILLKNTLEEAKVIFGNSNQQLGDYYNTLSTTLINVNKNEEAIQYLSEFIKSHSDILNNSTLTYSQFRTLTLLATAKKNLEELSEAKILYESVLKRVNDLYEDDDIMILEIKRNLCDVNIGTEDNWEAYRILDSILIKSIQRHGYKNNTTNLIRSSFGYVHAFVNAPFKAIKILEEALLIQKEQSLDLLYIKIRLAYVYDLAGRYTDARKLYIEILSEKKRYSEIGETAIDFITHRTKHINTIRF